jgi:hypothetical protein
MKKEEAQKLPGRRLDRLRLAMLSQIVNEIKGAYPAYSEELEYVVFVAGRDSLPPCEDPLCGACSIETYEDYAAYFRELRAEAEIEARAARKSGH